MGGCERIQGTPLPYAYVAHLHAFLLVVLCAIPIVYSCAWKWATLALGPLIAFAFLGIEAVSVENERPFAARPTKNHHDVERFAEVVSREVQDMLERTRVKLGGELPDEKPSIKLRSLYGLSVETLPSLPPLDDVEPSIETTGNRDAPES